MEHLTVDYGIDLGTTNSAICRMEKGVPVIIRSDTGMDTMPSCVTFKKGGRMSVGSAAYAELAGLKLKALRKRSQGISGSFTEFKRHMGSDTTYDEFYTDHRLTPEELSAKVIGSLCSFVTDDDVKAAVITVPAKFTVNQKDATLEAARLAGLDQVELLQEPIAASMAYGLTAEEKNGIWIVFDFGGGTLDVALVHVSDGIMQVFDTEGDNYLGGKNIDEAVVSKILMPELLSRHVIDISDPVRHALLTDALKVVAEKLKNALSYKEEETVFLEAGDWGDDDDGEEIELELTVTRQMFESAVRPVLQKAVDVCKTLVVRNDISSERLSHLILIGGPTYIPLLRQMLREQVTPNVETSIDPMTAVARGAAIYASSVALRREAPADGDLLRLEVSFESSSVDTESYVTFRTQPFVENLQVGLTRVNDGNESPLLPVGPAGALAVAELLPGCPNTFAINAFVNGVKVKSFPSEITVAQGTKAGSAILPYNIGIEVFNPRNNKCVFTSMTGLEKNRPLPASGMVYGLKTMSDLIAGDETSAVRIAIYQGDSDAEGKTAALSEHVSDVVVTGDDIISFIPSGSHVNVRIEVDRSEMMSVECEFPQTSQTVRKRLDTSVRQKSLSEEYLADLISQTYSRLHSVMDSLDSDDEVARLIEATGRIEESLKAGAQSRQVEQHIKEVMRQVEELETGSEWKRASNSLGKAMFALELDGMRHRDDVTVTSMIGSLKAQVSRITGIKDVAKARFLQHQIEDYRYSLNQDKIYRDVIRWAEADFATIKWTDRERAQKLVLEAAAILRRNSEAPLSEIKEVTEKFYAMIIHDKGGGKSTSGSGRKIDILSI